MDGDAGPVAAVEVACDESGSEGENLVGGNTGVFAHGSVSLDAGAAADCIAELRGRIRSPATEYKANHLLRQKHREVLAWFLGPSGPIHAQARVHLVDKRFFLVQRLIEVLAEGVDAGPLYRAGPAVFGADRWEAFLTASNDLLRMSSRWGVPAPVDAFFRALDELRFTDGLAGSVEVVGLLRRSRPRAEAFRAGVAGTRATAPLLDPLVPALVRTVEHWSETGWPVAVVHDEQRSLTPERLAALGTLNGRLAGVTFADSRDEPRVQVADFLAGVARRIAEDELAGGRDPDRAALLRPYVDPLSVWADERSWSALRPP